MGNIPAHHKKKWDRFGGKDIELQTQYSQLGRVQKRAV